MYDPKTPYDTLPLLTAGETLGQFNAPGLLRVCTEARAAIGKLDGLSESLPSRDVLVYSIPLMEAQASSEIENIVTTNDELFRKAASCREDAAGLDPAQKEAFAYRGALMKGAELVKSRPVCANLALELCRLLLRDPGLDIRKIPGCRLREAGTGRIAYTPPHGEENLRRLLGDWERFLNDHVEIDPLIRLAAGHYQFEAIHPFPDGNGRTGRMINVLFLQEQKLLGAPILYLSRAIIRRKNLYYEKLAHVTETGDFKPFVLFMLKALWETAERTTDRIRKIKDLMSDTREVMRARCPKIYSRDLLLVIFKLPYCRIRSLVDQGICRKQTASRYLHALADAGVLEVVPAGRDKLFVNKRYLDLLVAGDGGREPSGRQGID